MAVVVGAEQDAVVDGGGSAVLVFDDVVGFAVRRRGVAAGEHAALVAGDDRQALVLGEDAVAGAVGVDAVHAVHRDGDDSGLAVEPAASFGDRDADAVPGGRGFGAVGGDGEHDAAGDAAGVGELSAAFGQLAHAEQRVMSPLPGGARVGCAVTGGGLGERVEHGAQVLGRLGGEVTGQM